MEPFKLTEAAWPSQAIQLRVGNRAGAPLFLFPGVLGDFDELSELVKSLRDGRSIFGLRLDCLSKSSAAFGTIAEMANEAVSTIRAIQPTGPLHLVGFSFGGLVAFATAQVLKEGGNEVGLLALIATPISQRYWPLPMLLRSIAKRTIRHLVIITQLPAKSAIRLLKFRSARLARQFGKWLFPNIGREQGAPSNIQGPRHLGEVAMEQFRPGFYPGTLTYLEGVHDLQYDSRPWRGHAAVLRTYTFPTDHMGLILDPTALHLVTGRLDSALSSFDTGAAK